MMLYLLISIFIFCLTEVRASDQCSVSITEVKESHERQRRLTYIQTKYNAKNIDEQQLQSGQNVLLSEACSKDDTATVNTILATPNFKISTHIRGPVVFIAVNSENLPLLLLFLRYWHHNSAYVNDILRETIQRNKFSLTMGVLASKEWDMVNDKDKPSILLELICFASKKGSLDVVKYCILTPKISRQLPSTVEDRWGVSGPLIFASSAGEIDTVKYLTSSEVPHNLRASPTAVKNALSEAITGGHKVVIQYLRAMATLS